MRMSTVNYEQVVLVAPFITPPAYPHHTPVARGRTIGSRRKTASHTNEEQTVIGVWANDFCGCFSLDIPAPT